MGGFNPKRALDQTPLAPGLLRQLPFQIRRAALERAPALTDPNVLNSPLLAPIFGPDGIPPVFSDDDGLDVIPGEGIPGVSTPSVVFRRKSVRPRFLPSVLFQETHPNRNR